MSSNVPEARRLLEALAGELGMSPYGVHIRTAILPKLSRSKYLKRRSPSRAPGVTPEVEEDIRQMHRSSDKTQAEIAAHFGVNQFYVTRALKPLKPTKH